MSASPEEMHSIRCSIVVAIRDLGSSTAPLLIHYFEGCGKETKLEWVEEALHQLIWIDVVKRVGNRYYVGPKFIQYVFNQKL